MDSLLHIPVYAAVLGGSLLILQKLLMLNVGISRTKLKKEIGVDGNVTLERRVRRHGNLAENAAIFIVVLTLYELLEGQTALALGTVILFAIARLLHVAGFGNNAGSHFLGVEGGKKLFPLMRALGAALSAASALVLGGALIFAALT
ncbi:MAPEG family protein [Flexibacterium corallicola]|uniref:MAPEG family protein n=1 Tax=Flexibacterium corallicola TaxID=3037259 RepID=UPI00286EE8C7|nr:MAPEG family protein [Pseudovibrio sp. M1P-2-3]